MKKIMALWSALVIAAGLAVAGSAPVQAAPSFVSTAIVSPAVGSSVKGPNGKIYKVGSNPKGVIARKGAPVVKTGGAHTNALVTCSGTLPTCFHYAGGVQNTAGGTDGALANITVEAPFLATYDYHSLGEMAAVKNGTSGRNIVEIGWTHDRSVNTACTPTPACKDLTYLFTFAWVNGIEKCYNGCGFVQLASPAPQVGTAGGALSTGLVSKTFAVQHFGTAWWVGYGGNWAGYWPDTIWTGASPAQTFITSTTNQGFFEVASKYTRSCSDMGNGELPVVGGVENTAAARVGSWTQTNPFGGVANDMTPFDNSGGTVQPTTDYDGKMVIGSVRTGRGGGPGSDSTGVTGGTKGSC